MASVYSSSESGFTAADVYTWLADSENKKLVASDDLTVITKAFMKAKGIDSLSVYRGHKKLQPIVKKAMAAFSFVTIGNALRSDPELTGNPLKGRVRSTFARSKISQIFDTRVAPDRELLIPGPDDIEFFSRAWDQVTSKYPETDVPKVMAQIKEYADPEDMLIFPKAVGLFKLGRDPRLKSIPPINAREFIEKNYPELANVFDPPMREVFQRIHADRGDNFLYSIQECVRDRNIVKGALLVTAAHKTAVVNPDRVMYDIKLVNDDWKALQGPFLTLPPAELERVLRDLDIPPAEMSLESMKRLVALGFALEDSRSTINELDPYNRSLLSPLQERVWDVKMKVIEKAISAMKYHIDQMVQGDHQLDQLNVNERVQLYIAVRNEHNLTKQFLLDAHRYDQLVLTTRGQESTLFPGANDRRDCVPLLVSKLREFATVEDVLDPVLFAMLQESISQNTEKAATQEWINCDLSASFGMPQLVGFVPTIWSRECVALEKIDATHFVAIHEYNLILLHPLNGERSSRRIRFEFPIHPGVAAGSWVIDNPRSSCVSDEAPRLASLNHPIPLAAIAAPVEAMPKEADKPVVDVESDEEDWEANFAAQRAARERLD